MATDSNEEQESSSAPAEPTLGRTGSPSQRQDVLGSVVSAAKHVQSAQADAAALNMRRSDKVTNGLLVVAVILAFASFFVHDQFLGTVVVDLFLAGVMLAYFSLRVGIIKSLSQRQAILVWELMVVSFLLGIYVACSARMLILMQAGLSVR